MLRGALLAVLLGLLARPCGAQAPGGESPATLPQVLVLGEAERGAVTGDPPPLLQITPPQIQAYGVASVSDLLTELQPETQSGRGRADAQPVPLLNGRRVASWTEIGDIPAEAIERVDVFPEDVALRYGYSADQKVINFIVRENYRALSADAEGDLATEGGAQIAKGNLDYIRLKEGGRVNLDIAFEQDAMLLESQRGLQTISAGSPFDLIGNVTAPGASAGAQIDPALSALAGQIVTVAGVPVLPQGTAPTLADFAANANQARLTDLSPDRSLRPATRKLHLNAVSSWTTRGGIYASVNAGLDVTDTQAWQGLASASLLVPPGRPYSPFTTVVQVNRFLGELGPLSQRSDSVIDHVGFSLDGNLDRWTWSLTGNEQHVATHTTTQTGIDAGAAQALLDADDSDFDPFTPLPPGLLAVRTDDDARLSSDAATLQVLAQGPVRQLPAGTLTSSLKLGEEASRLDSNSTISGLGAASVLSRNVASAQMDFDIPLASRAHAVLPSVGDLDASANLALQRVSDFGALYALNGGLEWAPSAQLHLAISGTDDESAPSLQMLSSPTIATPNVQVFDYVSGQTVSVTQLSGGNPQLAADHRELLSLGLQYQPLPRHHFNLNANYIASATHHLTGVLPPATAAAEAAFPERFLRDADGELTEVDGRAVNYAREQRAQLRWGVNGYWPLGAGAESSSSVMLAIHDTWFMRDVLLVRNGLAELDLLNGATIGPNGGQPRQQIDLQTGLTVRWFGVRLSDRWHGATTVNGGSASADLAFADLMTANLRMFANLGEINTLKNCRWAHGLRVVLAADNVFNEHQRVQDATGAIPIAYQAAYLDPLGRVVRLDVRKVF